MIRIVNLTPHSLTVFGPDEHPLGTWPSMGVARVMECAAPLPALETDAGPIPIASVAYADRITELPPSTGDTAYVVSRVTAAAVTGRPDVYFPHDEVRDDQGTIIGCRGLGRFEARIIDE